MKKNLLTTCIISLFYAAMHAQCDYTVPFTGNNAITVNSGTLCDHAGTSDYSNNANGYTVINPVNVGELIQVSGTSGGESCCDWIRIYDGVGTSGTQLWFGNPSVGTIPLTTSSSGALTVLFTSDISVVGSGFSLTISSVPGCTPPAVPGFGSNAWNILGYNGNDLNLGSGTTFRGSYSESSLSYNTTSAWSSANSPSSASGWNGCTVNNDAHTVVAKRTGVPTTGIYQIDISNHDDSYTFQLNGSKSFENTDYCCQSHQGVHVGVLDATSTFEMRHADITGNSEHAITFTGQNLNATVVASDPTTCNPLNGSIEFTNPSGIVSSPIFKSTFDNATGVSVYADAVVQNGYLQLTSNVDSEHGVAILSNSSNYNASQFRAEFDFRVWGGTAADGFSFNYAGNYVDPDLYGLHENGFGDGLSVCFVTYSGAGGPFVRVKYNGVNVGSQQSFSIRNSAYRQCVVSINSSNQITVSVNGTNVITNLALPQAFADADKTNWQFAFAGRTGDENDYHRIDNVLINALNQYEYTIDGTNWTSNPLFSNLAGGTYTPAMRNKTFPGYPVSFSNVTIDGTVISNVSAGSDEVICNGEDVQLAGSGTGPSVSGVQTIFFDDFSNDLGWTLGTNWQRASAAVSSGCSGSQGPAEDTSPTADNNILGYQIGACYENSISPTRWATSPVINTTAYSNVYINFKRWLGVESSTWDHAYLQVYDGANWITIYENTASFSDASWQDLTYDVNAYSNANFQVRFGMGNTDGSVVYIGWNIDDFGVYGDGITPFPISYSWSPATGLSDPNIQNPVANPSSSQTYTLTVSGNGCEETADVTITVDEPSTDPTAITIPSSNLCWGGSVTLAVDGGSLGSGAVWEWFETSCGGTPLGTGSTINVSLSASSTNYFVRASETVNGGCAPSNCAQETIALPTITTQLSLNNDIATCYVNSNDWVHFYNSSGRLIASVNSAGQDLGDVTARSYVNSVPYIIESCTDPLDQNFWNAALARTFVISPTTQPTTPVTVRLYILNDEFWDYQAAAVGTTLNTSDDVYLLDHMNLTKVSGGNEDGNPNNNCGNGQSAYILQSNSGDINNLPDLSGFIDVSYLEYSIGGFSQFFPMNSNITTLPVELVEFSAHCEGEKIKVRWTTASEFNASHFILQSSRDGNSWLHLAQIDAAGTTSETNHYGFEDYNFGASTYYRLLQVDLDGKEQYYSPISVNCQPDHESLAVFPNPTSDVFTVVIQTEQPLSGMIEVLDLSGRVVMQQSFEVLQGTKHVLMDSVSLKAGTYIIRIQGQNERFTPIRIVKL